jgi:deaminated glutathione amidase
MAGERKLIASAIQITAVDGEKEATIEKMERLLDIAGQRGSDLVVLPELWTGLGFSDETVYKEIAEPFPGPVTDMLAGKARKYGMYVAGSMYEDAGDDTYYNSVPLISPEGEIIGVYRKTHLFDAPNRTDIPPGIIESRKVGWGDKIEVHGTNLARIGLSVCSDLRFPEVYREMALNGAEIMICASAFLSPRFDHWEFFLRARATENQTFVVASGQYGVEPKSGIAFVGRSMIVDPWGVIVATASDTEDCVTAPIDLDFIQEVRDRYPLMTQRRPELYRTLGAGG